MPATRSTADRFYAIFRPLLFYVNAQLNLEQTRAALNHALGVPLVEGADLMVDDDDVVYLHTIEGPARVDVIYRRIDDLFMDPEAFNPTSLLGVPGLMRAWKAGNVALANAPGAGVAVRRSGAGAPPAHSSCPDASPRHRRKPTPLTPQQQAGVRTARLSRGRPAAALRPDRSAPR